MNLNVIEWKEFTIGKIFRLEPTKGITTDELEEGNDIPYIGAKHDTQGFMQMCKLKGFENWVSKGNCIVFVQLGAGSAGYVNYMKEAFIGLNGKTSCGYIDGVLNEKIGIFLETILCKERPKYSFGRSWTGDRLENTIIKLPIQYQKNDENEFILDKDNNKIPILDPTHKYSDEGFIPDFKFMEDYIKSLNSKPITTSSGGVNHIPLVVEEWKEFTFKDFFLIDRGKRLIEDDREIGNIKYFSASQTNNGCTDHILNPLFLRENSLIYSTFGDCYYVNDTFTASDEISILSYHNINVYNALFIVTIVNQNKYKYAFGRKAFKDKFENEKFKLPIEYELNDDGSFKLDNECNKIPKIDLTYKYSKEGYIPDFKFMEDYIKSLPYGDKIA